MSRRVVFLAADIEATSRTDVEVIWHSLHYRFRNLTNTVYVR
jgi:hypothetical protein